MRAAVFSPFFLLPVIFAASTRPRTTLKPTTTTTETDEEFEWECGTDAFTKYISENQIDIDCPDLKRTVNRCCITHDDCYDKQHGRKFCDDSFCGCLEVATKPSKTCSKEDGPLFCNLVRDFGAEAYRRSGNSTVTKADETPFIHELEHVYNTNSTEIDHDYESQVGAQSDHSLGEVGHNLEATADSYGSR